MRRIIPALAASVAVAAAVTVAGSATAQEPTVPARRSDDSVVRQARETLTDLLASEEIDRIDFEATTYTEAMDRLHLVADTILESNGDGIGTEILLDQASQVIEALNSHKTRGLTMTFGAATKTIAVRSDGEARMLGELVVATIAVIREQYGSAAVSYRDKATKLYESVLLDVEEGSILEQYLEGIQRVAATPSAQRARYFK